MARLTKRVVDAAERRAAAYVMLGRELLQGFGLHMAPGRVRTYILNYRAGRGRTRRSAASPSASAAR